MNICKSYVSTYVGGKDMKTFILDEKTIETIADVFKERYLYWKTLSEEYYARGYPEQGRVKEDVAQSFKQLLSIFEK